MIIAQRFNAGNAARDTPKSRRDGRKDLRCVRPRFGRPYGTCAACALNPALKRWAIVRCPSGTRQGRLEEFENCHTLIFPPSLSLTLTLSLSVFTGISVDSD